MLCIPSVLVSFAYVDVSVGRKVQPRMIGPCSPKVTDVPSPQPLPSTKPFSSIRAVSISFGVVCFEVATRTEPFQGMGPTQVITAVAVDSKRPQIPESASASPDVVPLMEQCWKQEPADRPEGFLPVVEALARVVSRVGDPRIHGTSALDGIPSSGAKSGCGQSVEVRPVSGGADASRLESRSIKELLVIAERLQINTAGSLEKRDIVERIKGCGTYSSAEGAKDLRNKADLLKEQVTV